MGFDEELKVIIYIMVYALKNCCSPWYVWLETILSEEFSFAYINYIKIFRVAIDSWYGTVK